MKAEPLDKKLYKKVTEEATKKFQAKTGIYKSSWIVREYLKRGGTYSGKKDPNQGLLRWYREKWVDISKKGLPPCGRKNSKEGDYPLCRPMYRVSKDTPKTVSEVFNSLSQNRINQIIREKKAVKWGKNIKFF